MESGSAAARGVADIVLLGDSFGAMAPAFREGQRIVSGMQGITRLYVARILSAALLMAAAGIMGLQMPFVPTNMALYAMLTVGISTMLMALWAKPRRDVDNRLSQTLFFALPAAFWTATLGVVVYAVAYYLAKEGLVDVTITPEQLQAFQEEIGYSLTTRDAGIDAAATIVARSILTPFVILTGVFLINFAMPAFKFFAVFTEKVDDKKMFLVSIGMILLYFIIVSLKPLRDFYSLVPVPPVIYLGIAVVGLIWFGIVWLFYTRNMLQRFLESEF